MRLWLGTQSYFTIHHQQQLEPLASIVIRVRSPTCSLYIPSNILQTHTINVTTIQRRKEREREKRGDVIRSIRIRRRLTSNPKFLSRLIMLCFYSSREWKERTLYALVDDNNEDSVIRV